MELAPVIRKAAPEDLPALVATLSDSFAQDPILNWVIPAPELYPELFRLMISEIFLPRGLVHMASNGAGAALWLPPGEKFELPPRLALLTLILKLLARRGPAPLWRLNRQSTLFETYHIPPPHYYLQFIGCRRRDQGKGIGARLLLAGTRVCDANGLPAYLESSNERNVPLYQRHGFEIVHQQPLPGGGPQVWFMTRPARNEQ